jgi:hypothetical protein
MLLWASRLLGLARRQPVTRRAIDLSLRFSTRPRLVELVSLRRQLGRARRAMSPVISAEEVENDAELVVSCICRPRRVSPAMRQSAIKFSAAPRGHVNRSGGGTGGGGFDRLIDRTAQGGLEPLLHGGDFAVAVVTTSVVGACANLFVASLIVSAASGR